MTLYYYAHCPFCIRVLMLVLYKQIAIKLVALDNDDETTPISMIGKKMLPILKKADGSYMAESLDIIDYLDSLDKPTLKNTPKAATDALATLEEMMEAYKQLVFPRTPQTLFPEFQTASARRYFQEKKEASTGSFDECLSKTDQLIKQISPLLTKLGEQIHINEHILTHEDIALYPWIYLLQLVEGLTLPGSLTHYMTVKKQQLHDKNKRLILNAAIS